MRLAVLQPAASPDARRHYEDTVLRPVPLQTYAVQLGADATTLSALYPDGSAPLWGATPGKIGGNARSYSRMAAGDFVLFTGHGRVFAGATVTHVFRNAPVAEALWGRDDKGQTWELMFAVDEVRAFDIPYATLNTVVGYDINNVVQGFTVLDEERSSALFDYLSLDSDMHPAAPTGDELAARLAALDGNTERQVTALQRLEQGYLRQALLPGLQGDCALCGRTMPVQFLVAAHIKKRAACTAAERLDVPAIGMAACKFGCDALFEAGLIAVGTDGRIQISPLAPLDGVAGTYLRQVRGRPSNAHGPSRATYFSWHAENTFRR